ncbi:NAD(P)H-binding protein [Actinosynnema pretiosum subsp. pretiosum]|uniref:NAD(P)H-binding protein n=1 Tax=Actinosynnema pretiosum subsp. pretiosum TaxID=103721 RepID=A0AA45R4A5_9PSEU|nr:NADPH:quinone oxidoreductase 2 possible protective/detoxification role [Actinosynnema pretiosum subsp. pretiosum]QUF04681.1 NAD(P)H-binding protein [Actinosynnema pretiosum subsp. pretiosum]
MIVVTGATGKLGRETALRLLDRVAPEQLGVCVRDPAKARDLAARGVRVRAGDFADPAGLAHAFEGATRVLVVSVDRTGEQAVRLHANAVRAAVDAGVERVVYTSHAGARPDSPFAPMPDHAATEDVLRSSGVGFTALRNGFYASTVLQLLAGALRTGELAVPEDGPVAWTAHADLAEAAALALTGDAPTGRTAPLTAGEALDAGGIAELASSVTGRAIRRVVVSDERYHADLVGHGVPEAGATMLVGLFAAARRGDFATADPTLTTLLGRPPTRLGAVLAEGIRRTP